MKKAAKEGFSKVRSSTGKETLTSSRAKSIIKKHGGI